ncbi:MAG: Crp/Fnr family transcriptional regulator [Burkholderiaceae bacterium]
MNTGESPLLVKLAEQNPRRIYRQGTTILNEGDSGDELFVLLAGRIRVFSDNAADREITYGEYDPIAVFGEMALDGGRRSATVVALERSECAVITRQNLLDAFRQMPEIAMELLALVIGRARNMTESTRSLALLDVYGRLRELLERNAAPGSATYEGTLVGQTHKAIASRIGASREMVSRLLKDLERGGYIEVQGKTLRVVRSLPERW